MKGYFKGMSKVPIKLIPITVLVMTIYTALCLYIANYSKLEMENHVNTLSTEMNQIEWNVIEDTIRDYYSLSRKEAKIIALEVEYSLRSSYPNLVDLEKQFINNEFTEEFNSILKEIIQKNGNTNDPLLTMVGTERHLITMFSNHSNHILKDVNSKEVISWEDLAKITPDESTTSDALNSIISKNPRIIYTFDDPSMDERYKDTSMSMKELQTIYNKEGVEGLSKVTLLAPAYITDNGDIFGTEDTSFLADNDNHKIIITKAIDLGELLTSDKGLVEGLLDTSREIYDLTKSQGERTVFISILWTALSFLVSLFLVRVYNTEGKKRKLDENKYQKGGNDETMRGE